MLLYKGPSTRPPCAFARLGSALERAVRVTPGPERTNEQVYLSLCKTGCCSEASRY